jgi:hypothetical protein
MARSESLLLDRLAEIPVTELREKWARCYGVPAPNLSGDLLRLGISYRLREKIRGGISRETKRILLQTYRAASESNAQPTSPPPRKLTTGTTLVRDWHGIGHTVTVLDKGFEYDGKTHRSLTAIAKSITGTHRNGPRFFGLTR